MRTVIFLALSCEHFGLKTDGDTYHVHHVPLSRQEDYAETLGEGGGRGDVGQGVQGFEERGVTTQPAPREARMTGPDF